MDYHQHLHIAERLSGLLDNQFKIGPWKFGLDPIIGLIPVVGDVLPLGVTLYILWIGRQVELPNRLRYKMIFNAAADMVLGIIPIVGDITDFAWKANARNIKLLRKYIADKPIEGEIIAENRLAIQ